MLPDQFGSQANMLLQAGLPCPLDQQANEDHARGMVTKMLAQEFDSEMDVDVFGANDLAFLTDSLMAAATKSLTDMKKLNRKAQEDRYKLLEADRVLVEQANRLVEEAH